MSIKITQGTQTDVRSSENAGIETPIVKLDIGSGSAVSDFGGTLPEITNIVSGTLARLGTLQNLEKGTITRVEGGTIGILTNGTINGTVLTIGRRHEDEFATVVTSGTSVLGTIRAAVAGSIIYVTSLTISVQAPSNVEIASGGTSTPIAGTFFFAGSGGAALMPINPPYRTASGSALVYKQSANTGLSITATGYID